MYQKILISIMFILSPHFNARAEGWGPSPELSYIGPGPSIKLDAGFGNSVVIANTYAVKTDYDRLLKKFGNDFATENKNADGQAFIKAVKNDGFIIGIPAEAQLIVPWWRIGEQSFTWFRFSEFDNTKPDLRKPNVINVSDREQIQRTPYYAMRPFMQGDQPVIKKVFFSYDRSINNYLQIPFGQLGEENKTDNNNISGWYAIGVISPEIDGNLLPRALGFIIGLYLLLFGSTRVKT